MLAIAEVESAGKAFAMVKGRAEPLIRFEGHYFDRLVPASKRAAARKAGLAAPKAGAVKNPAGQAARWALLARAEAIDAKAARESVSWGVGQVMGSHWKWLGYESVDALVAAARRDVAGQIDLMARYIEKAGLVGAIRKRAWSAFAKGYNGPAYKANRYDSKMARAYARYAGRPATAEVKPADSILKRGSKGPFVAELQGNLRRLGYSVAVDGEFGPATEAAVKAFQAARGLNADGWAGPRTIDAIATALAERAAAPKIREAQETVPETAEDEVKEKTNWLQTIVGFFTGGGGLGTLLYGVEWQVVVAILGAGLVAAIGIYVFRRRLIAAFREINAEVRR